MPKGSAISLPSTRSCFASWVTAARISPAVTAALRRADYDGWIVVEQDVFPGYGTPKASAQKSREFLRTLGL